MRDPNADEVFEALSAAFPIRRGASGTSSLLDIRRASEEEATLIFQWLPQERLFGVPVSLTDLDRRVGRDRPARDLDEWLESVDLWLMEDVENGFTYRARRRRVDDYIELRKPTWAMDRRFYLQSNPRVEQEWTILTDRALLELDLRAAMTAQNEGGLVSWNFAAENNSTGGPLVGHSTIVKTNDPAVARLVDLAVGEGVPATVTVDLVRLATHLAAEAGARVVVSDIDLQAWHPDLPAIAGFNKVDGAQRVDTDFLAEDPDLADALFHAALANPGRWGDNRDRTRRYLPNSRAGRLLHRLRRGQSGTPPEMYAG